MAARIVHELRDLLFERHARKQVGDASVDGCGGVLVERRLGESVRREGERRGAGHPKRQFGERGHLCCCIKLYGWRGNPWRDLAVRTGAPPLREPRACGIKDAQIRRQVANGPTLRAAIFPARNFNLTSLSVAYRVNSHRYSQAPVSGLTRPTDVCHTQFDGSDGSPPHLS